MLSLDIPRPELLELNFTRSISAIDGSRLPNNTRLLTQIPQQFNEADYAELRGFQEAVEDPVVALSVAQVVIPVTMRVGMKYLWNQIYIVQFIIYFMLWKVNIPTIVTAFLEFLKSLASF